MYAFEVDSLQYLLKDTYSFYNSFSLKTIIEINRHTNAKSMTAKFEHYIAFEFDLHTCLG